MSESPATILRAAATLMRERAEAATRGPGGMTRTTTVWRLHGVHAVVPAQLGGRIREQVINHQIAKAPKQGTPYAEYWPNEADTAWITSMHPGTGLAHRRLAERDRHRRRGNSVAACCADHAVATVGDETPSAGAGPGTRRCGGPRQPDEVPA